MRLDFYISNIEWMMKMKKYKYNINNLDCAACAREIEEMLNKHEDFSNATVNFNTRKIAYESNKDYSLEELTEYFKSINEKPFRAKQVFQWLYQKKCF